LVNFSLVCIPKAVLAGTIYMAPTLNSTIQIYVMSLLTIILVLIVAGVLLWLINAYIPMDRKIKSLLNAVVVIVLVLWLLKAFGLLDSLKGISV